MNTLPAPRIFAALCAAASRFATAALDFSSPSSVAALIRHSATLHDPSNHGSGHVHHHHHVHQSSSESLPAIRYVFQMNLTLLSRPLGRWNKMDIVSYDSVNLETGDAAPVALKHERPFWFSKVRSYLV